MNQVLKRVAPLMIATVFALGVQAADKKASANTMTHGKVAKLLIVQLGGTAPSDVQEAFGWLISRNVTPLFGWGFGAEPKKGEKPNPAVLCTKADLAVLLVRSMGLEDELDQSKDLAAAAVDVLAKHGISVSELGGETAIKEVEPAPGGANLNDEAISSDPVDKNDVTKPSDNSGDGTDVSNEHSVGATRDELNEPAAADVVRRLITPLQDRDDDRDPTS